ncbi:transporter [Caballeronia sp. LP003]|uniref:VirB4 family type IV secretion/conjugal transfer ATPase n=1 Tax=Caballeronia sp. LP003 TaxID=3038551 RepID=UPI002861785E|nr:transporter [Caballeronia sp. LP003]MDR5791725.1 transporter [Caballeronia sp. LP003]
MTEGIGVRRSLPGEARMFFQSEFRDKLFGYSDLLRYASIIDAGVILGKGGELISSFMYRGKDTESSTLHELEGISQRINSALLRLGSGWMIHCTGYRTESAGYADEGYFPDPVSRFLDEERRRQYHAEGMHFEGEYIFTFTYLPPTLVETRAKSYLFEESEDVKAKAGPVARQHLQHFKKTVLDIVNELTIEMDSMSMLEPVMVHNEATNSEAMLDPQAAFMLWCATGIRQHVVLPKDGGMGLDVYIGHQDFAGGVMPRVGKKFIKTISIEMPPDGTYAGILHIMNTLPVEYRWTTRFIYLSKEEALAMMEKKRKKWRQSIRGMWSQFTNNPNGAINLDSAKMAKDVESAMEECNSDLVRFGLYTSAVVLYNEDPTLLAKYAEIVVKALREASFVVREEDMNAVEAFLGTLPGHGYENLRQTPLHTLNLADLFPTTAVWQGPEENPNPLIGDCYPPKKRKVPPLFYAASVGSTPFRACLHVGDVGHTLVIGPTGSGKSVLLGFMMAQWFRYPRARVFCFDVGYSAFVLSQALGGNHYDVREQTQSLACCPLARVDKLNERVWAENWIEETLQLNGLEITSDIRKEVRRVLAELGTKENEGARSLQNFAAQCGIRKVSEIIEFYTTGVGARGLLNGEQDTLNTTHFTVFELDELMKMGDRHLVPVMTYLFRCIERQLDGSPTLIVLDEAWLMLSHELFQDKLREWLKVLRKSNASVVFATQQISDVDSSPIRDTIYSACMTKILLPNREADAETQVPYYRSMGLNGRQIYLIARATPKRHYYFMSPNGRRLFELNLGHVALSVIASAGREKMLAAQDMQRKYGSGWIRQWMIERGVGESLLEVYDGMVADQQQYILDKYAA